MIGNLNNDNIFIAKYFLIYYKDINRSKHIELLKKYLVNFLNGITFINNSAPILNDKYEIIGIIISNINEINNINLNEIKESFNKKYKELEIKYNNLNSQIQKENQKLKIDLEKEKNNSNDLKNKNNELSKEIESMKLEHKALQDKILKLNDEIENKRENDEKEAKTVNLLEELRKKENELKEIQSRYPVILLQGEKLICVILLSMDQKIKYPLICKSTDKFTKIEELLYKEFPEYRESENIFLVNGQKVDRFQSVENNGIKDKDVITFFQGNPSFIK